MCMRPWSGRETARCGWYLIPTWRFRRCCSHPAALPGSGMHGTTAGLLKGSKPAVVPCIPEPGKAAGWEQQRRKRHVGIKYHPHLAVSRPLHGLMHILLCDAQIGKPFPHLVRTALPSLRSLLQTNRLKNYEVTLAAHIIVFRVRKILYHRLGQSNLVLGRLLCQHSVSFPRSHIHYNKETMSPYYAYIPTAPTATPPQPRNPS